MGKAIIKTYGLTKYYGKVRGIEGLDLEVREGEIFGFLGPNGSGKTTTIRLLLHLLRPTRGRAEIFGLDPHVKSYEIRQRLGYIPGEVSLYEGMTGNEFLALIRRLHNGDNAHRQKMLVERLSIDLERKIRTYSLGMKRKVAIVQALMNDPQLLILDEPTLGLDPLVQREFYRLLAEERERGKTIFLSSHILGEVERVCDRIGIVRSGRLVAIEDVSDLKRKKVRKMELDLSREVNAKELEMEGVEVLHQEGKRVELAVHGNIEKLLQSIAKLPVEDLVFPEATLEETFMRFYQDEASE